MALVAAAVLLAVSLRISAADVSLSVQQEVIGTWKSSVVLPCSYSLANLTRQTVVWLFNRERIFESNSAGDHTFLTKYRGKLKLSEDRQGGDVSLTITDLQTDDGGLYTCKVSLLPQGGAGLIHKEADITLDVRKVAVTKPVVHPGVSSLKVSRGSTVKLTCTAEGSPPITYRWYKRTSSGSPTVQAFTTSLTIENVDPSHSGTYYCEAENRIEEKTMQKSELLELSIADVAIEPTKTPGEVMHSSIGMGNSTLPAIAGDDHHRSTTATATEDGTLRQTPNSTGNTNILPGTAGPAGDRRPQTTDGTRSGRFPLYLIILIVVLCLTLLFALVAVLATRRRRKGSGQISEMPAMSALAAQANQTPPAVNICQINISQNNDCQNVTAPRVENSYGPMMAKEQEQEHDKSEYQNLLLPQENEYDLPLDIKKKNGQP